MKTRISLIAVLFFSLVFSGCQEYLEPNDDNRLTLDVVLANPEFAEGFIMKAYKGLPTNYNFNEAVASDDAVTNDPASNIVSMVNGGWNAQNNPIGTWGGAYESILYINTFLENMDGVEWSWENTMQNELFAKKLRSEAHALRAWYNFMLLQKHSGVGTNGELLGFPIVDKVLSQDDNYEIPRSSFADCVNFILADCDEALKNLPNKWEDTGDVLVDQVNGARNTNRINGLAVRLLKSRVALYAASPSYSTSGFTMQEAAQMAADVLNNNGGLDGLKGSDLEFYNDPSSSEIIWASARLTNQTNWERDNFPPSLFGEGKTGPSQNLVDAFPMADGTPAETGASYENRDPRLGKYILYNGASYHGGTIYTYSGSGIDAPGIDKYSTKTGYYLRKFLQEGVDIDPALSSPVGGQHFYTYARYTEALLNFAEAANEAVGPNDVIGGFAAVQIIEALWHRAGIPNTYLAGLDQAGLREVIRNERRIELCFEGHRFWDIRRWGLTNVLKETATGISIAPDQVSMSVVNVEGRNYDAHHIFGPVPYNETLKYDLIQNEGY
ncbi:RagB/SusD family nutrient uptake outer membrane protein [uncultured Draconibacterium sp.]|uniref:RagB/SusD family nutrient uptake outer membrane protein n=1 Tax=uncultured Draconibacterium sp. TaxID=1573823 RepID=UPI0029C98C0D|nr:RagB/SusD family nutrient uptake outer membrane protein [uncultured Draconibacterium sp.]